MEKNMSRNIILIYIGMYILLILLQFGLVNFTNIDFSDDMNQLIANSIINLAFYVSLAGLYLYIYRRFWKYTLINFKNKLGLRIGQILLGVLGIFFASTLVNVLYQFMKVTSNSENQESLNSLLDGPAFTKAALIIFSVFLAPIVEEMLFRFAGFRLLSKHLPPISIIILTSIAFGFIHVMGDNPVQVIYYAALGGALGTVYHYSKNILVPIGVHMIFNALVMVVMFSGIA